MRLLPTALSFGLLSLGLLATAGRAEAGPITAMPVSVAFPQTGVGAQSADSTVTFTNNSNANVVIESFAIVGADPNDFLITNNMFPPPFSFAGNGFSFSLTVAFKPTAGGARTGTLEATLGNNMGVVDVPLSGTAIGPKLTVTPNPINSGGTKVNVATQTTVMVGNAGGSVVNIPKGGITINGPNASEFSISNLPAGAVALGPANQAALMLTLVFLPTAQGAHVANLAITNDDPNFGPTLNIPIAGKAGDPTIATDIGTAAFGNLRVGLTSMPASIINVSNTGNSDLHVKAITVDAGAQGNGFPGDFVVNDGALPGTIPAGGSTPITVAFKPTAVGQRTARVVISSDDPNTPNKFVVLLGNGTVATLALSPNNIDFKTQQIYQPSAATTVTITNTGTDNANIISVSFTGAEASWFRTTGIVMPPIKIPLMGNVQISLVALPLAIGAGTGNAVIMTDDPMTPSFTIPLKVTGIGSDMSVAPSFVDFGAVGVLGTAMQTIVVTNTGTAPLNISAFQLTDVNSVYTVSMPALLANLPAALAPQMAVSIDVSCTPQVTGSFMGEIDFQTDDPTAKYVHVPLDCAGSQAGVTVSPTSLNFNQLLTGSVSAPQDFTITNTGGAPLTINSVQVTGNATDVSMFIIPNDVGAMFTIAANSTKTVPVSYQPTSAGSHTASVVVTPNGFPASEVKLSGSAVTPTVLVATSTPGSTLLDFGMQAVGVETETPLPVALEVPQNGIAVTIDQVTSSAPAEFPIDLTGTKLSLVPGAMTTFNVGFRPSAVGARTATISITLKGASTPVATIIMAKGIGVATMVAMKRVGGCAVGGVTGDSEPAGLYALLMLPLAALLRRRRRDRR